MVQEKKQPAKAPAATSSRSAPKAKSTPDKRGGRRVAVGKRFIIEDVRAFKGEQKIDIRPLTFITGENSTGKTTLLGSMQALSGVVRRGGANFNEPPYSMGAFDNIVRAQRGVERKFAIGLELEWTGNVTTSYKWRFKKEENGSSPGLDSTISSINSDGKRCELEIPVAPSLRRYYTSDILFELLNGYLPPRLREEYLKQIDKEAYYKYDKLNKQTFGDETTFPQRHIYSFASTSLGPIRAKPERTYDPIVDTDPSQGDNIPVELRNLRRSNPKGWQELQGKLVEFGRKSGLFDDVSIKSYGKSDVEPFQIRVKVPDRPSVSLTDVGYGVSQTLPILVNIFRPKRPGMLLMQQPEVHLHPKGQAELASLLAAQVKRNSRHRRDFVIETHSDYLIDRARVEVRRGNLAPEDLSIVFLQSQPGGIKIHNIKVDKTGNIKKVPPCYEDFFIQETNSVLGFDDE